MEDRDTAQRPAGPLGEVGVELRVQRLDKGAHEGDFEGGTGDGAFADEVGGWRRSVSKQSVAKIEGVP